MAPVDTDAVRKTAIHLNLDEIEALRLADLESIYQAKAAGIMGVSRSTYGRILESARHKLALALWEGQDLLIEGGDVQVREESNPSAAPAPPRGSGANRGFCLCPQCGFRQTHQPGQPCRRVHCPQCDISLMREGGERHRGVDCSREE